MKLLFISLVGECPNPPEMKRQKFMNIDIVMAQFALPAFWQRTEHNFKHYINSILHYTQENVLLE